MTDNEKNTLISLIDENDLISFDVFDTLLFRKTNTPEAVFDLVGEYCGIHGFRKQRMDAQEEASRRVFSTSGYPHPDINDIYEVLSSEGSTDIDWDLVKNTELELERDCLTANQEMKEFVDYAVSNNKRVTATTDMYLLADSISLFLNDNGFDNIETIYCSADEHKAKFNKELFQLLSEKENTPYDRILHIGDNPSADVELPGELGINTFLYKKKTNLSDMLRAADSGTDLGIYNILYDNSRSFWYNLGLYVGGPLYTSLLKWIKENTSPDKTLYCLSRDGFNLYKLLLESGYMNVRYLQTSRRALLLAGITELDEESLNLLPPYTFGQTVEDAFGYLSIPVKEVKYLQQAGFSSVEDELNSEDDFRKIRLLYRMNRALILKQCRKEREYARNYFKQEGVFENDEAVFFDCGWNGSSQFLIERLKKAIKEETDISFLYFGILNSNKSCRQLKGLNYKTFLFDHYTNYSYQRCVRDGIIVFELFFSAPHSSVLHYLDKGIEYEQNPYELTKECKDISDAIEDYLKVSIPFAEKYNIEYGAEEAVGHIKRLIYSPTDEEAVLIGNIINVDGFAAKKNRNNYVAYVTESQIDNKLTVPVYWPRGLLKRNDVSERVKYFISNREGIPFKNEDTDYHLEDDYSLRNYKRWKRNRDNYCCTEDELDYRPYFSIVIPVYNTETYQLTECIDSVIDQTYRNFELILVDDCSTWKNVVPVLKEYESFSYIHVIYRERNGHISAATNSGLERVEGDFIVFMDCDDILEPTALMEIAMLLNSNPEYDLIYSDEDKLTEDSKLTHYPFFKPDWSPDLFMSMNYLNHLSVYRASIVRDIGGLRSAYNGAQDYDFNYRFIEKTDFSRIGHISKILYHWRERKESVAFEMNSKSYAVESVRACKEDFLKRHNIPAKLEFIPDVSQWRVVYEVIGAPVVSIIIPSKDHPDILIRCIESIKHNTRYGHYEIVIVDNGSTSENRALIAGYAKKNNAQYIYDPSDFNFSGMCNEGAASARGEYFLFLNDDIEIFQEEWLERMLGQAQRRHVGAVGAKLFYPDSKIIQHGGVANTAAAPLHNFAGQNDTAPGYFGLSLVDYNSIAVTGACLMVEKKKFYEAGGFDESLPIAYNDVSFCLALLEKGHYNVVRNDVIAYHHESLSRGLDAEDEEKEFRRSVELNRLYAKFPQFRKKDPYVSKHLFGYTDRLRTNKQFDRLHLIELEDVCYEGNLVIDEVTNTDVVRIVGWSSNNERNVLCRSRKMLFQDPLGNLYCSDLIDMLRIDVKSAVDEESLTQYAGFEAVLDKSQLRLDLMPYRLGLLCDYTDGKKSVVWWENPLGVQIEDNKKELSCYSEMCWKYAVPVSRIQWHIDGIYDQDLMIEISGFAFIDSERHYFYKTSIVLVNEKQQSCEFDVLPEYRFDVTEAYPEICFLYRAGFRCLVFKELLVPGETYKVVVRMKNQFDDTDIQDLLTERVICVKK